ncbi:Uncharacterized protein YigE, DUF2233 family [Poseidonocella pacifica]|uniref:Uncharacterized protein YigE, DUF2233 family n=1 Tax=Poseidonocella pacifica TaxID=871651 RepID=A0A1I0XLE9_9RHOB|nr:phosphodiester glycosidase family protein [Poseidonocella pacifica]SFB01537.1 Uncharacterized protein YigE, DUF2233 family [Poseidonocella pacifica]
MIRWVLFALLWAMPVAAQVDCRDETHLGQGFAVCSVDLAQADLRTFLRDSEGKILGSFSRVAQRVEATGDTLAFAMNAGMFHADRSPVGLYVEDGAEAMRVIPNAGPGNFGMLPNGLLCIGEDRADVLETRAFMASETRCRFATQSGPMLLVEGDLHPRFLPDSTSRYVRNGVGTSADGQTAHFAISNSPVTFHEFAEFFRDVLGLKTALYFDGSVSRLYAPSLNRHDRGLPLGPMVGAVIPAN